MCIIIRLHTCQKIFVLRPKILLKNWSKYLRILCPRLPKKAHGLLLHKAYLVLLCARLVLCDGLTAAGLWNSLAKLRYIDLEVLG